jgi:hypothetical protein
MVAPQSESGLLHQNQSIPAFPLYGFHWRMKDEWISTDLDAAPVQPLMAAIWRDYLLPLQVNVIRFHIDVYAYHEQPSGKEQADGNAMIVNRLVSLCHFAKENDFKLIPILAGSGRYRSGKECQYPIKAARLIADLLDQLYRIGEPWLYGQVAIWQLEDEMNHFIRHAGWSETVYTEMLLIAGENIRNMEVANGTTYNAPRMVIFPADMMFFKDFLFRPWRYLLPMLRHGFYDFQPPNDLQAFAHSSAIDVIGVDMYPGLYAPLATTATFLRLVNYLGETYGLKTSYGKRILVAEAGCPTWPSGRRREELQLRFYQQMMAGLSNYCWSGGGLEQGFLGIVWYCFNDQKIKPVLWPPQEWRFGIVKTVPPNEWFATYPSEPKTVWYWLRDHVVPFGEA